MMNIISSNKLFLLLIFSFLMQGSVISKVSTDAEQQRERFSLLPLLSTQILEEEEDELFTQEIASDFVEKALRHSSDPFSLLYKEELTRSLVNNFFTKIVGDSSIAEHILFFAEQKKLPIDIVFALVHTESKFEPFAVNYNANSKDIGLFQLNSKTFRAFEQKDLLQIEINIDKGTE